MSNIHPNPQPCKVCQNHKKGKPFKIRDDEGKLFTTSFISNCPYCGRFLKENYDGTKDA